MLSRKIRFPLPLRLILVAAMITLLALAYTALPLTQQSHPAAAQQNNIAVKPLVHRPGSVAASGCCAPPARS